MKGTMKVAVMNGIGKMGYTTRPIPTPKEDEVLVKLEYVGICGSDACSRSLESSSSHADSHILRQAFRLYVYSIGKRRVYSRHTEVDSQAVVRRRNLRVDHTARSPSDVLLVAPDILRERLF